MKIVVIGIGLIGGSLALDIKEALPQSKIFGIDANLNHLDEALALGVIHYKTDFSGLSDADMVIISVPVDCANRLAFQVLDLVPSHCIVFDVGSTKAPICEFLSQHPKRKQFMATHPIAGTEFSGPSAALKGLFKEKTNIICEVEKTSFKLQEKALKLFDQIGMRIRYMDSKSHDKHIAYVSHLSHISSYMLCKTVMDKEKHEQDIFDMAGSGFESTVRLAKSSPTMWLPIFKQNKIEILETLKEYIANLVRFQDCLESENFNAIYDQIEKANRIKNILKGN